MVALRMSKDMISPSLSAIAPVTPRARSRARGPTRNKGPPDLQLAAFHFVQRPLHLQFAAVGGLQKHGDSCADKFERDDAGENLVA